MFYCNQCGRYFNTEIYCCPYCGCRLYKCVQSILLTGPQGKQGATGPQGVQGAIGPQGIQGATGPQGVQGATGPQGIQGATGPQGIQGETGPQGIQGETGSQGIQGATGPQGIQGATGPQGIQGETGPQGIQGATGPQGIQGATGPQGIQGATGPQGIQGEIGLQGIQGETGPQGATGLQGAQGYTPNIGENGNWYINGTDTGEPSRGQQGDSAANYTTVYMSAIHTSGISLTVPVGGIAVPMSNTTMNGFSANGTFDTFTADYGGVYFLIYNIKTTASTTVKSRVMRNGVQLSGTVRSTSVATTNYSLSLIIRLTAGDQLQLQLYDLNDVVVGLQGGTGASLVLIRLSE